MTYPQPNANQYAANGYQFFRLNTLLQSSGDIYESEQSGLALALGPESDIAKVGVSYFDDQADNFMGQTVITPDRSFVGRVDSNLNGFYTPAQRPGRILIYPQDLWNSQYIPTGWETGNTSIVVTPRLDVIEYFANQQSLIQKRNDKVFRFQDLTVDDTVAGIVYVTVPFYGRKFANFKAHVPADANGAAGLAIEVRGVTVEIIDDNSGFNQYDTFLWGGSGTVTNQRIYQNVIKAGTVDTTSTTNFKGGMYDLLTFKLTSSEVTPLDKPVFLEVIVSDTPSE